MPTSRSSPARASGVARSRGRWPLALGLAGAVLVLDQVSKWMVRQDWAGLPLSYPGARLRVSYNTGISFSQLQDTGALVLILVAAVAGGVTVALFLVRPPYRPALGVVLGGALGNLIDRLHYDGAVLDFIGVWRWPSFNVADVAVVAGTAWLIFLILRGSHA